MIYFYGYHTLRSKDKKKNKKNITYDKSKISEAGIEALKKKKFIVLLREPAMSQFSWFSHRIRECVHTMDYEINDKENNNKHNIIMKNRLINSNHHCEFVGVEDLNKSSVIVKAGKDSYYKHLWTFSHYINSNKFQLDEGYYQEHLQQWIDIVGRDKIFVMNFNYFINNPGDSLYRISKFLNIENKWGSYNVTLPHANDSPKQHVMKCKEYKYLYYLYKEKNKGLYELINSIDRPTMEPPFEKFEIKKEICNSNVD